MLGSVKYFILFNLYSIVSIVGLGKHKQQQTNDCLSQKQLIVRILFRLHLKITTVNYEAERASVYLIQSSDWDTLVVSKKS